MLPDRCVTASPSPVLRGLGDAREDAGPNTPDAASEAVGIGPCLPPRFELGHGNACERVLPVVNDGRDCVGAGECPVGESGGAHFASHAFDLVLGCAHDGEALRETWEETGGAHLDRWPLVFLDEPDKARPLDGRTCAFVVEEAT